MRYSQVNYFGSFLPFNTEHCHWFSKPIEKFVNGNLRISSQRVFTEIKNGGLGLTRMSDFLNCQKCGWIPLLKNANEKWKIDFLLGCGGAAGSARESHFPSNPILKSFARGIEFFRDIHFGKNQNFWEACIYENKFTPISIRPFRLIDRHFWDCDFIKSVKVKQLFNNDTFVNREALQILCDTEENFKLLKKAANNWKNRYVNNLARQSLEDFNTFCSKYKKGSGLFKNLLKTTGNDYVPHNIIKFIKNTDSVIELKESGALNCLWTLNMWDNATKTFIFKLHNNSLGYNLNVSKFVRGHSPLCTFCSLTRNPDDKRETLLHLFYQCRHVEPVI